MKKIFKILLGIFLTFTFCYFVFSAEEDEDVDPVTAAQRERAKQATEDYCKENKEVKGCVYNPNDTMYTVATFDHNFDYTIFDELDGTSNSYLNDLRLTDIPLRKGYQAFDGNGNGVFVGCYRATVPEPHRKNASSAFAPGTTVFIFKVIYSNKEGDSTKCKHRYEYVVPEEGAYFRGNEYSINSTGDGRKGLKIKNGLNASFDYLEEWAHFNAWKATHNGECPNIFGYASNVVAGANWLVRDENKYVFSETSADWINISVKTFGTESVNKARPGCVEGDVAGRERTQELLDEVLAEISNRKCPDNIEEMSSFQENFESWYKGLRENNKFREMWSVNQGTEVTKDVENQIINKISQRINVCKYDSCGIPSSKKSDIINVLSNNNEFSICKNGCSITSGTTTQSSSPNAKCYLCDYSVSGFNASWYTWTDKNTDSNKCKLQEDMGKDTCMGTLQDKECRTCLGNAYEKSGLTKEQYQCLSKIEMASELTILNLKLENEAVANADIIQEQEENSELREKLFNTQIDVYELYFSDELITCSEILGPVISQIVKGGITIIQIVGAIIAIVKGMLILVPAVIAKDADALKKASKTLVTIAIILALIIMIRPLIGIIGHLLEYDTSCIL